MKFTLPGLPTAMALRGLDVDQLVATAHDAGKPIGDDTIRKALAGRPVSMVSATRIASVLSTRPLMPGMADLLKSESHLAQGGPGGSLEGGSLEASARQQYNDAARHGAS